MALRYQLRDYVVKPGAMTEWLREWRAQIVPLRRQHGFQVVGAWTSGDHRFIWILAHERFEDADRDYYESPTRAALSPDPARHLDTTTTLMMEQAFSGRLAGC